MDNKTNQASQAETASLNLTETPPQYNRLIRITKWFGLVINISLAVMLFITHARIIPHAQKSLSDSASNLRTLSESFDKVGIILSGSTKALESTSTALLHASRSIQSTTTVIDTAGSVIEDIGEVLITGSTGALVQVEAAAAEVDRALEFLSFLGLLGDNATTSEISLSQSIDELTKILGMWPSEFEVLSTSLNDMALDISEISDSLEEIREDLLSFLGELRQLTDHLDTLSKNMNTTADDLDLWAGRLPLLSWIIIGFLELLILVNALPQLLILLGQEKPVSEK